MAVERPNGRKKQRIAEGLSRAPELSVPNEIGRPEIAESPTQEPKGWVSPTQCCEPFLDTDVEQEHASLSSVTAKEPLR